jgi:pimeloyl-ACP methyl ester carboxylesterase
VSHPANTDPRRVDTRLGPLSVATLGDGPPAVLWHSMLLDSTTWTRVCEPLATTRRLIMVDAPNHGGQAGERRPFSEPDCVGAARDILDTEDVRDPVDWLGCSLGGRVGVLFAEAHPDRCRTLTAIGAPMPGFGDRERRLIRLLARLYRVGGPRAVMGPVLDSMLGPKARTEDPVAAALVEAAVRRADRRGMYDALHWIHLNRRDLTPLLETIKTPTLFTTGPDDPYWTVAQAGRAAARMSNGARAVLPGAGHVGPLFRAPAELVELVRAFWANPLDTVAACREAGGSRS